MMKAMPLARRQIAPTASATTAPTAIATATCAQPLPTPWKVRMPTA